MNTTKWYHYILAFFAGIFLINVLPHFISGISGRYFPTPFANPPGKGLSSPILNVTWATINLLIGALFFYAAKVNRNKWLWIPSALGGLLMAFYLASYFGELFNNH
jgi:hypothetical protein